MKTVMIPVLVALLVTGLVTENTRGGLWGDEAENAERTAGTELRIGTVRVGRVLFLGNSITLHGPLAEIGWTGNWGMAASRPEKDYVHRLLAHMAETTGKESRHRVRNIADFERAPGEYSVADNLTEELAFRPDLIIVAIGENATTPQTDEARAVFSNGFSRLLTALKERPPGEPQPTILVRSCFWADAEKDGRMKAVCAAQGVPFVDVGHLGMDESHFAGSERAIDHAGVAGHPGDKGMQALADALWQALLTESGMAGKSNAEDSPVNP